MEIKILLQQHCETVFEWEMARLPADLNEIQKEMSSWESAWRKESLDHYADLGWSFIAENNGKIEGYLLGQTLLFFNKWTQSLWIEHLAFSNDDAGFKLIDTVIRWAKSKHLQKVLFNANCSQCEFVKENFGDFKEEGFLHYSTTKMNEE